MGKRSAGRKGNGSAPARAAGENAPPSQTRASHSIAASRKRSGRALGRPMLSRLLYWTMVLGLWASMAAIGALVVAAATLPPFNPWRSLNVPRQSRSSELTGTRLRAAGR